MKQKALLITIICFIGSTVAMAQESGKHWEYKMYAGYNLGGSSPIPLPAEIRRIKSWSPGLAGTLGIQVTRWIAPEWGITSGLAIDIKGMKINADVKYMTTNLVIGKGDNTGMFSGMFTGGNKTNVRNDYLVIPLMAAYAPKSYEDWKFRLGGYFALQRDANFDGSAFNGHIRNGGPAGDRINVDMATFDFSEHIRKIDAGFMASADWYFSTKMAVTGQLSWGLVPLFPSDFNGVPYKMYNIYFMGGLSYKL
jgi:hypothetical protein